MLPTVIGEGPSENSESLRFAPHLRLLSFAWERVLALDDVSREIEPMLVDIDINIYIDIQIYAFYIFYVNLYKGISVISLCRYIYNISTYNFIKKLF